MLDRFSGSMITIAIAASAQAPGGSAAAPAPAVKNALGRTRSAGHLDRRKRHALPARSTLSGRAEASTIRRPRRTAQGILLAITPRA
jgi:hypothetical protein